MVIDIILALIILLAAFNGYKKGLVGILIKAIGFICAIILAFILQNQVANTLYTTSLGENIKSTVKQTITNKIEKESKVEKEEKVEEKEEFVENKIENSTIDIKNNFYTSIINNIKESSQVESVSTEITMFILKGISFIVIFITVIIISYILQMLLNIVFKLPLLDSVNKVGGIGISIVMIVFKIWILLAIIYFIMPVISINMVTEMIEKSYITKFMFNNNILVSFFSKKIGI